VFAETNHSETGALQTTYYREQPRNHRIDAGQPCSPAMYPAANQNSMRLKGNPSYINVPKYTPRTTNHIHAAHKPPSMIKFVPFKKRFLTAMSAICATSSGRPNLPTSALRSSSCRAPILATSGWSISVSMYPGEIVFTRISIP